MRRLRQLRGGGVVPKEFVALGHLLHDLRLYKSRAELKLMREAAGVVVQAQLAAWQVAVAGRHDDYDTMRRRVVDRGRAAAPCPPGP